MGKQLVERLAGRIIRAAECAAWGQADADLLLGQPILSGLVPLAVRLERLRWAALLALLPGRLVSWADRVDTERRGRLLSPRWRRLAEAR